MEEMILISYLNDFIFCPISIYFHKLYGKVDKSIFSGKPQIEGSLAHKTIDNKTYSTRTSILQSIDVYTSEFNIIGKIDTFDITNGILTERKNHIAEIYDGYIFQLYAQYYALTEMGYDVKKIRLHSMKDNKNYNIELPDNNVEMQMKFRKLINSIKNFKIDEYSQTNAEKCKNCIYESICDRSLIC